MSTARQKAVHCLPPLRLRLITANMFAWPLALTRDSFLHQYFYQWRDSQVSSLTLAVRFHLAILPLLSKGHGERMWMLQRTVPEALQSY